MLRTLSQELGIRHRLLREEEEVQVGGRFLSRYRFAHALFQAYLYNGLSSGERRLLHGEIAAALEALYGDQAEAVVAQLAHHYDAGGRAEKAVEYALRAGDQARLAYANEEAKRVAAGGAERVGTDILGDGQNCCGRGTLARSDCARAGDGASSS